MGILILEMDWEGNEFTAEVHLIIYGKYENQLRENINNVVNKPKYTY